MVPHSQASFRDGKPLMCCIPTGTQVSAPVSVETVQRPMEASDLCSTRSAGKQPLRRRLRSQTLITRPDLEDLLQP